MPDAIAAALTRIAVRQAHHHAAQRLSQVIARQRRELAAEAQTPKE